MSVSLSVERDRIQRQVEQLEQSLSVTHTELELLSSETDDESDDDDTGEEGEQSAAGLLAQREKIQKEIQNLESVLGPHSPISVPDDDGSSSSSSSDESELGLSLSVESCLQMNLVYQQVVQETLDQLETLLTQNQRQQKEVESQLSGPTKESVREQAPPTSCQLPTNMYLGRFLKPYFKDKLTSLGPPANQETKEKSSRMIGCLDNPKLKIKRWSSWQKILLIHSVSRDGLRRLIQPKLSKVDYLSQKLLSAQEEDRQQLREQVDRLEREIDLLREKKEEELIGDRYEEHDWQKISNIDFEGTRDAEDISCFWQNFLHPSINKSPWSQEEVQRLKEVSGRHGGRCWENIAAELGTGRTAFLCLQTFQRFVSHSLKRSVWTPVEDDLLREMVDKMRIGNFIPYTQISYFMEGRGPTQLIYRWTHFLDPSLKRGPWTPEEDQLLLRAVSLYGEKDWWKIRMEVPGRHDGACRDRYYDSLKAGLRRGGFDKEEQMLLLKLVEKHGVGRWAKIAAEIPNRNDGQCLREWKKLSKAAVHPAQKRKRKPPASQGGTKKEKRRSVRRQMPRLKKEEEAEIKEEEETLVEYMDSDEEEKKKHRRNKKKEVEEVKKVPPPPASATTPVVEEKEEEEEAYSFPPMQEWAPSGRAPTFPALRFRPVDLPSSSEGVDSSVRSTILGQYGRSVVIGPPPTELPAGRRRSSGHLMMVSPEQLRAHLRHQVDKFNKLTSGPQRALHSGRLQSAMRNRVMDLELQAAVTPWIGNLLIPRTSRLTATDILRERGEERQLSSTPIFLLLLQTMNVDSVGCKEMIEKRRSKAVFAPSPDSSVRLKNPKTIAGMLQRKAMGAEPQVLDPQRSLIPGQLEKRDVHHQLLRLPGPAHPSFPGMLRQNRPQLLLQMPPHIRPTAMTPRMPPTFFPQAVFIPPPVHQPPPAASICLLSPSSLATPLAAPPVPVTCPLPAPSAPGVPGLAEPQNTVSICSTQNIQACSAPAVAPGSTNPQQNTVLSSSVGSTCTIPPRATPSLSSSTQTCPTPSPSSSTRPRPARGRRPKVGKAVGGRQNGALVGGACAESEGGAETVMVDGRRPRRLTEKARALQEAAEIRAECKKRAVSCSKVQKISPAPMTNPPAPLQHLCSPSPEDTPPTLAPPPAAIISSSSAPPHRLFAPPVSGNSCSGTTVAPPPSVLTDQRTAMSTSGPPNDSFNDHDYATQHFQPAASQHDPTSIQPCPAHKVTSGSTPKEPSKPPLGRKKRVRVEEQLRVKNGHHAGGGDTVGGSVETVGGASGVVLEGKRVRKPSQRARALQEEAQAKVEAKKKRRSSSSPVKKRHCESLAQKEAVLQNQVLAPGPGFCLGPGQSMWVMAPVGFVRLAEAPPQRAQLKPPGNIWNGQLAAPLLQPPYRPILPVPVHLPLPPPPTSIPKPLLQGVIVPSGLPPASTALPHPPIFLPYKGTIRADPSAPPPLRREPLQFDPSLMFLESRVAVCDWLSGRGGVRVPGVGVSLPYLPPFVSSLSTLSALLCTQTSLTKSSMQLLTCWSEAGRPQTESGPDAVATETPNPQSQLPDSTSDFTPAPPGSTELLQEEAEEEEEEEKEKEEEEHVVAVRQLVAERFSSNPAYQLLKSRFLSCFTVPALLATVKPIRTKTVKHQTNQEEDEEEDEEEAQFEKIKERGKQRRAERSLLLRVGSGAPANHFSGISHIHTAAAWLTRPDRTDPKEGGQEGADRVGPVES